MQSPAFERTAQAGASSAQRTTGPAWIARSSGLTICMTFTSTIGTGALWKPYVGGLDEYKASLP